MALLRNKKKLRRLGRLTASGMAGRAVLTLALVGMLAAPAMAALDPWDGVTDVPDTDQAYFNEPLNLTVNPGLIKGEVHGSASTAGSPITGTLGITGTADAKLTLTVNSGVTTSNASMALGAINFNHTTLEISSFTGTAAGNWNDATRLVAGLDSKDSSITNSKITLGDYSLLMQGLKDGGSASSTMTITGSTIAMNGAANDSASILAAAVGLVEGSGRFSGQYAKLVLNDTTITVDANKHGVILSYDTVMNGGELDVKGKFQVVAGSKDGVGSDAFTLDLDGKANGTFVANGTAITVATGETLKFSQVDLILGKDSKGKASVLTADDILVGTSTANEDVSVPNLSVAGGHVATGELKVKDSGKLSITDGGKVVVTDDDLAALNFAEYTDALTVQGETITVGSNAGDDDAKKGTLNIAGTTLVTGGTTAKNGALAIDGAQGSATFDGAVAVTANANGSATLTVSNGAAATFNEAVTVTGAVTDANAAEINLTEASTATFAKDVTLAGTATKGAAELSLVGTSSATIGGKLTIGDNSTLTVDSIPALPKTTLTVDSDLMVNKGGTVTVTTGSVAVAGNVTIDKDASDFTNADSFSVDGNLTDAMGLTNTGDLAVVGIYTANAPRGEFTATGTSITVGALNLDTAAIIPAVPTLTVAGGTDFTFTGQGVDKALMQVKGTAVDKTARISFGSTGALTFNGVGGSFAGTIDQTADGTVTFGEGAWNIGTLNSSDGAVTVTDSSLTIGKIALSGTSGMMVTSGMVNVVDLGLAGTSSLNVSGGKVTVGAKLASAADGQIDLNNGGTLSAGYGLLFTNKDTLVKGLSKIANATGLLEITGVTVPSMSLADAKDHHKAIFTGVAPGDFGIGLWTGIKVNVTDADLPVTKLADGSSERVLDSANAQYLDVKQLGQFNVGVKLDGTAALPTAQLGQVAGVVALLPADVPFTPAGTVILTTEVGGTTLLGKGSANPLVIGAGKNTTDIMVADNAISGQGVLNLGMAGVNSGGVLNGSITNTIDKDAIVNVAGGTFIVAGIDLVKKTNIGDPNPSSSLNLKGGNLTSLKSVSTDTLNVTDGKLIAGENITATSIELKNGSLFARSATAGKGVVTASGGIVLSGGSVFQANSLVSESGSIINGNSFVQVGKLDSSQVTGNTLVGDDNGKGALLVDEAIFNGSDNGLFLDPIWTPGGTMSDASSAAIGKFTSGKIDGDMGVGRNSHLTLGSNSTAWLQTAFHKANLTWGKQHITAALGLYAPQILAAGNGIMVDGSLIAEPAITPNTATFGANSMLVVNAAGLNGSAALASTAGEAKVDATSRLLLVDGMNGHTYNILSGFTAGLTGLTGWADGNLIASSRLQKLVKHTGSAAGDWAVDVQGIAAKQVFPGLSNGMATMLDSMYLQGLQSFNSPNAGVRFLTRATDNSITVVDAVKTLDSAAQMALSGGAPVAAHDAIMASGAAMAERTGVSMPVMSRGAGMSSGDAGHAFGVWATPLYRSSEISKQKTGGSLKYGVDSDLFGGIIGADVTNPLMGGDLRFGTALNVGGGKAKSHGGFAKTKNDFDFWGASIYTGYRLNNFGLSADLGFTSTASDIKQDLLPTLNMGSQLKSKVDSNTYTVGLKAEYVINTSVVDITPSVGLRYMAYRQGRYNVESVQGTVFNMGKSEMNTWTFPVGVKFSRDLNLSGWKLTPEVNLAVIPAAGDTKLKSVAHVPGMMIAPASVSGHVFDAFTAEAGIGIKLAKDNLSFGLNYDFQGGSHMKAHNVFGSFRYTY